MVQVICPRAGSGTREMPNQSSQAWFILYLEAVRAGAAQAETYWERAVAKLDDDPSSGRAIAAHLRGAAPLSAEQLLNLPMTLSEKRVVLAALGARDPANRAAFLARAAQSNVDPAFPHHLVAAVTAAR